MERSYGINNGCDKTNFGNLNGYVRVSWHWCIFHTVPVMANRATTFLRKRAYGEPVIEVIFNQAVLEALFTAHGLVIHQVFGSIPYDLSAVLGERTWTLTYLCHK